MSSHKNELSLSFERSLAHVLKHWAARQAPPNDTRARLLRAATADAKGRNSVMQFNLWFDRDRRPAELRSLFYAPQFSYMGAWINF